MPNTPKESLMDKSFADLPPDLRRRLLLEGLRGFGLITLLQACGGGGASSSAASNSAGASSASTASSVSGSVATSSASASSARSSSASSGNSACSNIPGETAGPYPADGTNSNSSGLVNVLTQSGIVRSDIRASFGSASGVAAGVPLTLVLTLTNTACTPLAGYAVYLWHCNRDGNYSLYSNGITAENYLRGVQVSDANGEVRFTSIFPGCYSGRWPHIHFEVYASLAAAVSGNNDVKTSQLALPASSCATVYGSASGQANLAAISLSTDNVFSDDSAALQMASVSGDLATGYTASLRVSIAA
jgi:protocatechuate 3,4-dioxygenase beta subunit